MFCTHFPIPTYALAATGSMEIFLALCSTRVLLRNNNGTYG